MGFFSLILRIFVFLLEKFSFLKPFEFEKPNCHHMDRIKNILMRSRIISVIILIIVILIILQKIGHIERNLGPSNLDKKQQFRSTLLISLGANRSLLCFDIFILETTAKNEQLC